MDFISDSGSENPSPGPGGMWVACLERITSSGLAPGMIEQTNCEEWSEQGLTSTLIALRSGDVLVPVIETYLEGATGPERTVIHLPGGTGGGLFQAMPAIPNRIRQLEGPGFAVQKPAEAWPEMQLLKRGLTIASVGYWGTQIRTMNIADEVDLAKADVRAVFDFYADGDGNDPPLIATSLGNHIALGALGEERLEQLEFLSIVPVMDGLQHHLANTARLARDAEPDELHGSWSRFQIFNRSEEGDEFKETRMQSVGEHMRRYLGKVDLPLRDFVPQSACSRTVLPSEDYRTREYLGRNPDPPPHILVWQGDHDLFKDAPDQMQALFREFAECLGRNS